MPNAVNFTQSRNQQLVSLHRKISVLCRKSETLFSRQLVAKPYECSCARKPSLLKYASQQENMSRLVITDLSISSPSTCD